MNNLYIIQEYIQLICSDNIILANKTHNYISLNVLGPYKLMNFQYYNGEIFFLINKNCKSEDKINDYLCIHPHSQVVSQSSTTS